MSIRSVYWNNNYRKVSFISTFEKGVFEDGNVLTWGDSWDKECNWSEG
jgi:hypothetical protein